MIASPAIQKRVEIDEEMGRRRRMETAARSKLNDTWATILEVMRISNSVRSLCLIQLSCVLISTDIEYDFQW